jgi:hypothetical protein
MVGMDKGMLPALYEARLAAQTERLRRSNEISARYGLTLGDSQIRLLIAAETESLRACGRLEFGEGILPRLIYTFCDSPFIVNQDYGDTLEILQDLFYTFKNELNDELSDDELLEAMRKLFHGRAQGSLEYLENMDTADLLRALRSDDPDEDDDDDGAHAM